MYFVLEMMFTFNGLMYCNPLSGNDLNRPWLGFCTLKKSLGVDISLLENRFLKAKQAQGDLRAKIAGCSGIFGLRLLTELKWICSLLHANSTTRSGGATFFKFRTGRQI